MNKETKQFLKDLWKDIREACIVIAIALLAAFALAVIPCGGAEPSSDVIDEIRHTENWFSDKIAHYYDEAEREVQVAPRARCDLVNAMFAIEVEWLKGEKIYEAIGQALAYSIYTGKRPGIVYLFDEGDDDSGREVQAELVNRALVVTKQYDITVWVEHVNKESGRVFPSRRQVFEPLTRAVKPTQPDGPAKAQQPEKAPQLEE